MAGLWMLVVAGLCLFPVASHAAICPNEVLRSGPSASLPDCRAYELVSSAESNGRLLSTISAFAYSRPGDFFPSELSSPDGNSFIYMTHASALANPLGGGGVFDSYLAEREAGGWVTTRHLSLSRPTLGWPIPGGSSADHSYSFQNVGSSDGDVDYLRGPDGSLELTGVGSLGSEPQVQGRYISEGGGHVIFTTGSIPELQNYWCAGSCLVRKLETLAAPTGTGAIYDRAADGPTHAVSVLPGEKAPAAGEEAFYKGVSKDGTQVAFTIGGVLYVRVDNAETLEVAGGNPAFGGFSDDGTYLFYVVGGDIHRFAIQTEADDEIASSGDAEMVNAAADGSRVYFISEQQLDGGKGTFGQPNMYLWEGGAPQYVATVLPSDLEKTSGLAGNIPALTKWTDIYEHQAGGEPGPGVDSSRSTPDGAVLAFESRAQLTTYDNDGHTEIYRYDDSDHSLLCLSCNTHVSSATADARFQELMRVSPPTIVNNLSEDGDHVFFETAEALLAEDTNNGNDIYEWQREEGAPALSLISSGKTPDLPLVTTESETIIPRPNLLLGVSPDGSNVYFTAQEALAPGAGEGGTQAIYDARVGGGFPAATNPVQCMEEGCRSSALSFLAPFSPESRSESMTGSGNVKPRKQKCHGGSKGKKHKHCARHHAKRQHGKRAARSSGTPALRAHAAGIATGGSSPGASPQAVATPPALDGATASAGGGGVDANIEKFEALRSTPLAGAHPNFTTFLEINHFIDGAGHEDAGASPENITFTLPPGMTGYPSALPSCSMGEFANYGSCPAGSQVGITRIRTGDPVFEPAIEPVYNIAPPHPEREVARFGFMGVRPYPVFIDVSVRTAGDYGVTATVHGAPGLATLIRARTVLWGDPAGHEHDKERMTPVEVPLCPLGVACQVENGERASGIKDPLAFMTNPSACQEDEVDAEISFYQLPGERFSTSAPIQSPVTDCVGLPFAPSFDADPSSHEAGAPTGLRTKLVIPQHLGPDERSTATMREARVTLPEGMQVAAGAANWIGTCSDEQVGYHEEVDTDCPDNSKLGTATFVSPALSVPIEGTIYQRAPEPGRQLGLWLTADALGLHIKLPGSLEPDKQTGRLTAVFTDLPQVPVEEIDLNVWGGPRAPLQNPDHCGTFTTDFSFAPHSNDPSAIGQSTMQITEGCNQGFSPTLHAGVTDPVAGKFSPFVFDLTRPDGNQALRGFELKLPDGELAKIKGVPLCSDADASAANCPAGSRIGHLQATTGPGPEPFTLPEPGKPQPQIYLSGPYQGSPFSIVSEVSAQAGPFDLGTLAVRSGLDVEPETGRAVVKADPLPQFFEGVGIAYRHLHAVVDRPEFNLNPTDCREMAVTSDVTSTQGTVAHPQARFQVDGCKALKFKPKLSLKLKGGTKRADYPALTAVLKARKGDANIAFTSVALPHSEFIAQEHFVTICTRKQFAADKCPKGSVYGKAKAITPLLDKPLSGPVYLRSSDHPLPDLVVKLGGQLEIVLVGRVDAVNGGLRTSFESIPDAPVSKFTLQMRGGKKGLFVNSTDICRGAHMATVRMRAQNGRTMNFKERLTNSGCGKKKTDRHKKHR